MKRAKSSEFTSATREREESVIYIYIRVLSNDYLYIQLAR